MAPDAADLIIRNARLFTGGDPRRAASFPAWSREGPRPADAPTALAVVGDRVTWLGGEVDVKPLLGPSTQVIDAEGGLVTPGFEDAHVHLSMAARSLALADLDGATSIDTIATRLREWQAAHPTSSPATSWVVGRGWHYGTFAGGMPDRALLDRLVPDRPAMLESFDGHTHWLNSAALAAAGITASTLHPRHGTIERDAAGEPTGILKEFAHELLDEVIPGPSDPEMDALLRDALARATSFGVTALQDAWTEPADLERFARLRDRAALDVRLRVATPADEAEWTADDPASRRRWADTLDAFAADLTRLGDDAWLRGGVVKAFADGVVESGTGWMLEPYDGAETQADGSRGRPTWPAGALDAMTSVATERGWQVEIHAIGDAAIRAALDAHERSRGTRVGADARAARAGRIEHVEWPDPRDVPRFARLGVTASVQPTHSLALPHKHKVREDRLGARVEHGWPIASLLHDGALVVFGSDWPIATVDPLRQLHAAVTRRDPASNDAEPWLPAERLSLSEALACTTWGDGEAGGVNGRRGTIAPGVDADLVVIDRDVLAAGAESLLEARVAATIIDGRVVYRAADR